MLRKLLYFVAFNNLFLNSLNGISDASLRRRTNRLGLNVNLRFSTIKKTKSKFVQKKMKSDAKIDFEHRFDRKFDSICFFNGTASRGTLGMSYFPLGSAMTASRAAASCSFSWLFNWQNFNFKLTKFTKSIEFRLLFPLWWRKNWKFWSKYLEQAWEVLLDLFHVNHVDGNIMLACDIRLNKTKF